MSYNHNMKIAIFSDVHDNLVRWSEAAETIKDQGITIGVCCGDVQSVDTLKVIAESFEELYLCFGNADYTLPMSTGLIPENVKWFSEVGEFTLDGKDYALVHNDQVAKALAESGKYDIVLYGHTHTPWEKIVGKTKLLNPGEISGRYGRPSFAILDTETLEARLELIN